MNDVPVHNSSYDAALEVAVRAARRGAVCIRSHANQQNGVRAKGKNDFVTDADEAAQEAIVDVLRDARPDVPVMAEEGAPSDDQPSAIDGRRWIVDPIDGTTNFMHRVPPYAVSIALQEEDEIVVGVVLNVPHDELFTAVADHGLQLNGQPAGVSDTDAFSEALLATGFPYRRFEHTEQYLDVLGTILRDARSVRRHGAASVDLAWLACGRFDGFFETGLSPWDVAAGVLLVREGGGRVTDYRGANGALVPLFDQQVCATNGAVHSALLQHLAPMQDIRL
jgi:myo-inositol-1(or 4)-monophosphatase